MPTLYYDVEAPGVNILETITNQVILGLLKELGLEKYFKESIYIMSSFMAASQFDTKGAVTVDKNRCDVNVSYILNKSQVPWPVDTPYTTPAYGLRSSKKGNHTPILYDSDAHILIEQQSVACALDMDVTLTFVTFDEATKAFDRIKTRYEGSLIQTPFDLSFSYPVSFSLLEFLTAVYKRKLAYQSKTLLDYINDYKKTQISFDVRKSQLTDPDADVELLIRNQQLRCLAQLTLEQKEPEVTRIDELPEHYTINFSFVIQFGRPNLIKVNTPVSVDNQLLPYELFKSIVTNYHNNSDVYGIYTDLMVDEWLKRTQGNYSYTSQILRFPKYDDWLAIDNLYNFYDYRPFLIMHFTLDDPVTQINLNQLGDAKLHPIALTILKDMGNLAFQYGGIFNIGVYANNLRLDPNLLTLDEDLTLTIDAVRKDQVYHLVFSESTNLRRMTQDWDQYLIKYRYFFPLTIERNLQFLIDKRYFYIAYDNSLLTFIDMLMTKGILKSVLNDMVLVNEDTYQLFSYTQNPSQLADYLAYTPSSRKNYTVPTGTDSISLLIKEFYSTYASSESRSLLIAFYEQCLIKGYLTLETLPKQYISPNDSVYPYLKSQGGYYGFNTPVRVFNTTIIAKRAS